jgi:hypothetical protein
MYSRVTQLEIDTLRIDLDGALAAFRDRVVPSLFDQEGYEGAYVFATPEGRAMLLTFWDTEEQAAETPFYGSQITEFFTFFRSPPGRESYEVLFADVPAGAF